MPPIDESETERLNAEILYWMAETDKRKEQLGEYLLDEPCDPDDCLWERLAAGEVESARARIASDPCAAMGIIMTLVREKQACLMWLKTRDGTIARLAALRTSLEAENAEMKERLSVSQRQAEAALTPT